MRLATASAVLRTPAILLVEDDEDCRSLIALALERMGYRVVACEHGAEAIDRLSDDTFATGLPHAIVLDWMMPVMTGPEVLSQLTLHPAWSTIPVIVVSAVAPLVASNPRVVAALQKPVRIEALRVALERLFGRPEVTVTVAPRARSATAS